jgi:predicted outer membrane repeat protein
VLLLGHEEPYQYGALGPEFRNCRFVGNTADHVGGAIGAFSLGIYLKRCTFEDNRAQNFCAQGFPNHGGGAVGISGDTLIVDCRFINNRSEGPGGAVEASAWGGSDPDEFVKLINCEFRSNTASGSGGAVYVDSDNGQAVNCLFFDNVSDGVFSRSGGGFDGGLDLLNCTFVENHAADSEDEAVGGGADLRGLWEIPAVHNCIFRGNAADNDSSGEWYVEQVTGVCCPERSNIEGFDQPSDCGSWPSCTGGCQSPACAGNIDEKPEFVDPENGDFHLLICSPGVDGGYESPAYPQDEFDVNENDITTEELTPDIDWESRVMAVPGADLVRDMGYDEMNFVVRAFNPDCPCDCEAEPDGFVDIKDFLSLLAQWGSACSETGVRCDILSPPGVGIKEFLLLLANWGDTCAGGDPGGMPQSVEQCMARFPGNMELLHMCLCMVEPCGEGCPPENCK